MEVDAVRSVARVPVTMISSMTAESGSAAAARTAVPIIRAAAVAHTGTQPVSLLFNRVSRFLALLGRHAILECPRQAANRKGNNSSCV
jgi:hypothetical protein